MVQERLPAIRVSQVPDHRSGGSKEHGVMINRNGERQCEWCGEPMPNAFKLAKTCSVECRKEYQRDYFRRLDRTAERRDYQRAYQNARYHRAKSRAAAEQPSRDAGVTPGLRPGQAISNDAADGEDALTQTTGT